MFDLEVFLYWFCYFDAICTKAIEMPIVYRYYEKAQNAHVRWNVLPRMIVGRWWFFLEKHWKTGWNEQDVCGRLPCMTALRYEPCKNRAKQHRLCASSHRRVPLYFCMARSYANFPVKTLLLKLIMQILRELGIFAVVPGQSMMQGTFCWKASSRIGSRSSAFSTR